MKYQRYIIIQFLSLFLLYSGNSSNISNSEDLSKQKVDNSISTGSKFRRNDKNLETTEVYLEVENNDHIAVLNQQNIKNLGDASPSKPPLLFDPPILEYGQTPVCIPSITIFTITNNMNVEFDLISILSDNSQFYPVVFQPQIVNPKESVQIQILYLPFYPQLSKAILTITTSIGNFEYYVNTAQAYNSYHLHPFIGYRIASGMPFQQPISIYNPHDQPLHIREIYTTEEFLSLEGVIPSDLDENHNQLSNQWILDPGVERNIIMLSMSSAVPGYYTGYVHVKTNFENIVIPVELKVLDGGLHATPQAIDFGVLTNIHDIAFANISILNSGNKPIEIIEILPAVTDPNLEIMIIPENKILMNNTEITIAQLVYKAAIASGKVSNKIIIITNHSNPALAILEIPYDVSCVHGGIGYEFNQALYILPVRNISNKHIVYTGPGYSTEVRMSRNKLPVEPGATMINGYNAEFIDIRNLTLTNYFSISLQISHVQSVTCPDVVSLQSKITPSLVADSLQSYPPITLLFNKYIAQELLRTKESLPHQCWLDIHTNFSAVRLPLVVIDGNIDMKPIGEIVSHIDDRPANQTKGKTKNILNSDVLSIRIPFISSVSPRPIEIQFTNINPIRIPVSILSSTHNMTICWKPMDGTADSTSFSGHDYFSGHLFHPTHQPTPSHLLSVIDNICHRYSNSSFTPPGNSTYFIKSEQSVILTIYFESLDVGANKTEIRFVTPYQAKILNIHYHGITGSLIHSYHTNQTTLTMGKHSVIDIYTYSSFQETVQIDYITSSSRLLPVIMHTPSQSDHQADSKSWKSNQTDLGFLTAHIMSPYLECLVPYSRLRKINIWGCTIVLLEEWLSSMTTTAFRPSLAHSTAQKALITDEEYTIYLKMLDILRPIEGDILTGRYDIAMQHIYEFRAKWLTHFPHGLPIPEFNIVFKSTVTASPFSMPDVHIQTPLSTASFYSNFIVSPITYSQVVFLYFIVVNPYDVVLELKLLDDHLPPASFTEYDLEKLPDLDNFTSDEDEQHARRDVYPFEIPERLFPYSHVPNSIGGAREIKKLMLSPADIRGRQRNRKVQTSLSSMSSGEFLEVNDLLSQTDDFFVLKALVTIPRYMMNSFIDHPPFSRFTPSSNHLLQPHSQQLLGPIAFVPVADFENSSPNDRYYNLSLYIHNNYTGIEKVEVLCPVSKIHISVTEVGIHSLDAPDMEPIPSPSSLTYESLKSFPGLITLSPINSFFPATSDRQSSTLPLVPSYINEVITIMANQESFTVNLFLNNTSRVYTVIDKILVNGKYDICRAESLFPDHDIFPVFPKPLPVLLASSHICQTLPLILSPSEIKSLNLTFRVNCLYLSEHFTLSLLSNIYSSTRSVFLIHCSVYLTMSNYLSNICRMNNFDLDTQFNYLLKLFGLVLLVILTMQTQKMSVFLSRFVVNDKKRVRPSDFRNRKSLLPNPRSSTNLTPSIHPLASELTNEDAFPYLRKGIQLHDIPPIIDPLNCHFEAIDTLKSKRINKYYGRSPGKSLKSAASSGSISNEEINLEDIDENIRNQIVVSPPDRPARISPPPWNQLDKDVDSGIIQENSTTLPPHSPNTKTFASKRDKVLSPPLKDKNLALSGVNACQETECKEDADSDRSLSAQTGSSFAPPIDQINDQSLSDSDVKLGFLGSEASAIDSISPVVGSDLDGETHIASPESESPNISSEFYPPNSFDNYESHEMWEHEEPPQFSSRTTSVAIGLENMVSEILEADVAAEEGVLKSDSTDSAGMIAPSASYDDWQFQKTKEFDRVPTPPPGFAGALGTYDHFAYYQDPLSPRQDPLQVPLDPSYLRDGTSEISPSHGAIGENNSFLTPPRVLPSTPNTSSPSHHPYPQFLSLPPVLPSTDDLLGDDAEWEAMLTMPFEDMRGQMSSLSHLTTPSPFGSVSDSHGVPRQNPIGFNAAPRGSLPPVQSYQQPLYRSSVPSFSYDGRVGRTIGNYPQRDVYGQNIQYGNSIPMQPQSSPNRSFQNEYQSRQYHPRRSYDGNDFDGNSNSLYEIDRRIPYRGGGYGQQMVGSHPYGVPHPNYPYPQSELFGLSSVPYHQGTSDPRMRDNNGGMAPPGLSPGGGYYQGQPNQYSSHYSQRENNSHRHNQQ